MLKNIESGPAQEDPEQQVNPENQTETPLSLEDQLAESEKKFNELAKQPNNVTQEYTDGYGQRVFGAPGHEKIWNEIVDLKKQVRQKEELEEVKKATENAKRDLLHKREMESQQEELKLAKEELKRAYRDD